jgi:hypothetical protein
LGEDDRAVRTELLILASCTAALLAAACWCWRRNSGRAEIVNAVGSVLACGTIGCEVVPAPRLLWVLAAVTAACAVYFLRVDSRCVMCQVVGARAHKAGQHHLPK